MRDFQKRKKIRKILYSPIILLLLAIILVLLLRGVWSVYTKAYVSSKNLEQEHYEFDKLNERQAHLAASLEYLKTDQGIEGEIRNKFRVVKDGEFVAVIIDENASTTESKATTTLERRGFWYRLFH